MPRESYDTDISIKGACCDIIDAPAIFDIHYDECAGESDSDAPSDYIEGECVLSHVAIGYRDLNRADLIAMDFAEDDIKALEASAFARFEAQYWGLG